MRRGQSVIKGSTNPVYFASFQQDSISAEELHNETNPDVHKEEDTSDEDNDDDSVKMAASQTTPEIEIKVPKFKNSDKETINYSECTVRMDKRSIWCDEKYGGTKDLVEDCENTFCTFCCEDLIRNI